MVKRVINAVDVVDVDKRRVPTKHYVYVINVTWSDGSQTVVYRRYSRFFELQVRLLELFPDDGGEVDPTRRMIPFLPGKIIFGRSHVRNVAMKRLSSIDSYCKSLIRLPGHISECFDVLQFFQVEDEDLNPIRDDKDKRKSAMVGEVISEPMLLEQYVAIAEYKKKQKNEVNLRAGTAVEVVEKNENGWWFVNVEEEQGWVPASYLEPAEGGGAGKESQPRAKQGEEEKFVTVQEYKSQARDEISFEKGVVVDVIQKNLEGWWRIRYQGKEGIAPAAYLQYMNAKPVESSGKSASEVEVVGTATDAVQDSLRRQSQSQATPANSSSAKAAAKQDVKPEGARRLTSQGGFVPRRQSIKVTKKMRSQSQARAGGGGGGKASSGIAARAAAAAVAESIAETTPKKSADAKTSDDSMCTVLCEYQAVGDSELSVREGETVEVIERNDSGWWFVESKGQQGWVPSTSFETSSDVTSPSGGQTPRSSSPVTTEEEGGGVGYVTIGDFESAANDGISFKAGRPVTVLEKAASGWWYVMIDGVEGWAPSSYLEQDSAKSMSAPQSPASASAAASSPPSSQNGIDITSVSLKPVKSSASKQAAAPSSANSSKEKDFHSEISKVALKPTKSTSAAKPAVAKHQDVAQTSSSSSSSSSSDTSQAGGVDFKSELGKVSLKSADTTSSNKPKDPVASASSSNGDFRSELGKVALKSTKPKPAGATTSSPAHSAHADTTNEAAPAARKLTKTISGKSAVSDPAQPRSSGSDVEPTKVALRPTKSGPALSAKKSPKLPVKATAVTAAVAAADTASKSPSVQPRTGPKAPLKPGAAAKAEGKAKVTPPARPSQPSPPTMKASAATAEKYVAVSDYADDDAENLSLREGDVLELVEKNDSGWWLMKCGSKEGWAPSTYFEPANDDVKPKAATAVPAGPKGVGALAAQIGKMQLGKGSTPDGPTRPSTSLAVASSDAPKPTRAGPAIPKFPEAAARSSKTGSTVGPPRPAAMKLPVKPASPKVSKAKPERPAASAAASTATDDLYVVTSSYDAADSSEISLREGAEVVVVEKADSGWWCVKVGAKEGWAPSTYLEKKKKAAKARANTKTPAKSSAAPSATSTAKKAMKPKTPTRLAGNRASAAYHGESGEVSFEEGESLEVLERADTGWWFVRTQAGVEGWAPSTYIN